MSKQCAAVTKIVGEISAPEHNEVQFVTSPTYGCRFPSGCPFVMARAGAAAPSESASTMTISSPDFRILSPFDPGGGCATGPGRHRPVSLAPACAECQAARRWRRSGR